MTAPQSTPLYACINCDKYLGSLRCTQCKDAWYCSQKCQVAHWKGGHKSECKVIAAEKKKAEDVKLEDVEALVKKEQQEHNEKVRSKQKLETGDVTTTQMSVKQQFADAEGEFPCGELHAYKDYRRLRYSDEEARERERAEDFEKRLKSAREAAEVHRQARAWLRKEVAPGKKLIDLVEGLEARVRLLSEAHFPDSGTAFATGCSVNEVAAHFSPNPGDTKILKKGDVVKFDFGVQRNGTIIDSAWSMCFEDRFKPLVQAVQEATEAGIKAAGIGVRLYDIGCAVQEVMESHEVELDGKMYQVQCIENLNGHNLAPYRIHHTKTVPIVRREAEMNLRMEEGEFFAIETFGSIRGEGYVEEVGENSHYMVNYQKEEHFPRSKPARKLYQQILDNFGTLCWCPRYMERLGVTGYEKALKQLVRDDIVHTYPPLSDIPGSYTAQFEHTMILRPTCKEVLSRGDDY